MLGFSLPYILLFLFYFLLSIQEYSLEDKSKIRLLLFLVYIVFFGFSGLVGTDWFNYKGYYDSTDLFVWNARDYELSFSLIAKVMSFLDFDYAYFKFLIVCIQAFLLDRLFSKYAINLSFCYCVLLASFPIVIFDLLRNFTAILIALNSIHYFINKKYIQAYSILILSVTFHISCIVFLFFIPVLLRQISKQMIFVLFVLGTCIYLLQIHYIGPLLQLIADIVGGRIAATITLNLDIAAIQDSTYGLRIGILEKMFFMVLVLYKYDDLYAQSENKIFLNMFICYILIYLFFSEMEVFINRVSVLFSFGYIIVLPQIISSFTIKANKKALLLIVIVLLVLKTNISYSPQIYEYSNVLLKEDNVFERERIRSIHYQ